MKHPAICENHLYVKAYNNGKKSVQGHIIVYVLKDKMSYFISQKRRDKKKINRVGLAVKKNIGISVQRNRVKRIIRSALFELEKAFEVKTGYLIVIVARPNIVDLKSNKIEEELVNAYLELGLICNEKTN